MPGRSTGKLISGILETLRTHMGPRIGAQGQLFEKTSNSCMANKQIIAMKKNKSSVINTEHALLTPCHQGESVQPFMGLPGLAVRG